MKIPEPTKEEMAERIIRDILYKLMPTIKKGGVSRFVNFEGDYENFGITLKGYAIDHNIPPFNRQKDKGLIF